MVQSSGLIPTKSAAKAAAGLLAIAGLAVAPPATSQDRPTAGVTDDADPARELLRQGLDAMKKGKFDEARSILLRAYEHSRSFDVAGALGNAELELRRYRDAAEHLAESLRGFPTGESLELKKKVRRGLETAKKHVGTVRLVLTAPEAEVLVDGTIVAPVPPEIFLEPGTRTIEARLGSGEIERQTIDVAAGEERTIELDLRPASPSEPDLASPAPAAIPADPPPTRTSPSSGRSVVPIYVGAGLTAVGAAAWIGFGISAGSAKDDLSTFRARYGDRACSSGSAPASECAGAKDDYNRQRQNATLATIGMALTLTAGAATVAYVLWWPDEGRALTSRPHWKPAFAFDTTGGGAYVTGSF
jgi:hypothetical protein